MPFGAALTTEAELREIYPPPAEMDLDAVERRLEASDAKDLWLAGGQPTS